MDSVTIIVPAVLGGVALSVMALVSLAAGRRRRAASANAPQVAMSRVLIHDINDDRCTGCDACVAVCPTNVLDLVGNKSRVLNFADCIQCEACMWACPTEALVMHPQGTEPPPLEMPELDAYYQTAVPGQYLIGEVAGKPLVKNAANLGRGVVEHMLSTGLRPGQLSGQRLGEGSDAANVTTVDVAIVGSGPGGLSAALTCIQRGLSYVVLEKDQMIASTLAHYPKGKLIMAEPYDSPNLSFLPIFDSSKEQILPLWQDLIARVGVNIKLGEAVEKVERHGTGSFSVRTTVAAYRAQRVVLATGTRGKPRTLGVPGENLPKVSSLLDDPDIYRGQPVLVVGGGDSACEAALALADAGAKVIVSYRGKAFSRAQPKNKAAMESYAAQRRIKAKFGSQVEEIAADSVTLVMHDGTRKKYPNLAAFVLIGADPPIKWLNKMGIEFVKRPHQFALSKSDELVRAFVPDAAVCSEDPAVAAAMVRGEPAPAARPRAVGAAPMHLGGEPVSGPRKWIRSATNIFTSARKDDKELDKPMPLSEFARRGRRKHTGHGRRDALEPRERTRVLRMLRDEGGRIADEESQVYLIESRSKVVFDSPPPGFMQPPVQPRQDEESAPKQAVIVGLARAMAEGPQQRKRRPSAPPPRPPQPPAPARPKRTSAPPPLRASAVEDPIRPARPKRQSAPPPRAKHPTRPPPSQFLEAPTVQVDPASSLSSLLAGSRDPRDDFSDEATRAVDLDPGKMLDQIDQMEATDFLSADVIVSEDATGAINIDTGGFLRLDDNSDESTRAVDVSNLARLDQVSARELARRPTSDEATRNIDLDQAGLRRPNSLSDVDWDLD
ncbi:MAG TPA: NAD(P)-binding domain-containing protein [Kofleriaceae bacterium]|nr:NAD(P)-binding domain-containing protein [Kofleriaceae bacterium]